MSRDGDDNNDGDMMKLHVTVPKRLLEEIDKRAEELEYTNRSEFIREVLRDTTKPILTPGAQDGVSAGYADVAAGRTMSTDEARERLGIDQDAGWTVAHEVVLTETLVETLEQFETQDAERIVAERI